ncbi:MAG TPA: sugar transferase [Acidimicrobiales bacterium]|nr:sugar transferase [Acidimicrobiales bacterium]
MGPGLDATAALQSSLEGALTPATAAEPRAVAAAGGTRRRAGVLVDAAGITMAATAAALAQAFTTSHRYGVGTGSAFRSAAVSLGICVPALVAVLAGSRRRARAHMQITLVQQVQATARPLAAGALACLAVWRLVALFAAVPPAPLDALLFTCAFALTTVAVLRRAYHSSAGLGRRPRRVVILGSGIVAQRVAAQLTDARGVDVIGFLDDDPQDPSQCVGKLSHLSQVCADNDVDHVVVAFSRSEPQDMVEVLRPIEGRLPITVVPRLFDVLPAHADVDELASGFPGITVSPVGAGRHSHVAKRALDVVASAAGIMVLSPVLACIALAIRVTSSGPVLFRQTRIGRDGNEFSMLKFRTMHVQQVVTHPSSQPGTAAVGPFPKLKDDPRITSVGRLLRRKSLDELPQLFNVLLGSMSLVGPRPFVPEDAILIDGWACRRYSMPPGITGLWQVSGRNDLTFDEMSRLDQLYVSHWSLLLDLRILFRTVRVVATGYGAY